MNSWARGKLTKTIKAIEQIFSANGKLLLTGEYFVLDGALALALPVRRGQTLDLGFSQRDSFGGISDFGFSGIYENLHWVSLTERGERWFEAFFQTENFDCRQSTDAAVAERLQKILREARSLNPDFLQLAVGSEQSAVGSRQWAVTTRLDFPREWGLGTSSTLIFNVAQWAQVDPFELQFRSFGGSGYDIACAGASQPILYQLNERKPHWEPCQFSPTFANCLYFIYLGKKQDSRAGIAQYRKRWTGDGGREAAISRISQLTHEFLAAKMLAEFEILIVEHERLVGEAVQLPRAKSLFFNDFWGEIKSLGAWGGDFVLATSERPTEETRQYFIEKGCPVFFFFQELAL